MRWRWWRRHELEPGGWPGPPARLPDPTTWPEPAEHSGAWLGRIRGNPVPGLVEPTQALPALDQPADAPLMTPAQRWRGNGGRW